MQAEKFPDRAIVGLQAIWERFCIGVDKDGNLHQMMSFRTFNKHAEKLYTEGAILWGKWQGRWCYYTFPSVWMAWLIKRQAVCGGWPDRHEHKNGQ